MSLNETIKQKLIDSTGNKTGAVVDSSKLQLEKEFIKNVKSSTLSQLDNADAIYERALKANYKNYVSGTPSTAVYEQNFKFDIKGYQDLTTELNLRDFNADLKTYVAFYDRIKNPDGSFKDSISNVWRAFSEEDLHRFAMQEVKGVQNKKENLDNKGLQRTRLNLGLDYDDAAGASHYAKSVLYSIWDDDFRKGEYGTINANEFYSDLFSRETILTYHQILSDEIDVTGDKNYTKADKSKFVNNFENNLQRSFGLRKSDVAVIRDMFKDKAYLFNADFNAIMSEDESNVTTSRVINQPSGNVIQNLNPVVAGVGFGGYKPVLDNLELLKKISKEGYSDSQPSLKPKSVKANKGDYTIGLPR